MRVAPARCPAPADRAAQPCATQAEPLRPTPPRAVRRPCVNGVQVIRFPPPLIPPLMNAIMALKPWPADPLSLPVASTLPICFPPSTRHSVTL
jgi:hypothetical protein